VTSVDSVEALLADVPPTVLGRHLAWIVDQSHMVPQVSPRRTLLADQAAILIEALDRRDLYEVVVRALREPCAGDGDGDDADGDDADGEDAVVAYAGRLAMATVGQPEYSPYLSLARSASRFAASVLRVPEGTKAPASGPASAARS